MSITEDFWERCAHHEFCLGMCLRCGTRHYYPQAFCPHCGSSDVTLKPTNEHARLLTYTHVMTEFYHGGSPFSLPYTVALAELHDGVRVLSKMREYMPSVHHGMLVRIEFQTGAHNRAIPVFAAVEEES